MSDLEQKWNMQYVQLVEFKRKKGHCVVPRKYEQDESLGQWVARQRGTHNNNKIQPDRKIILDELGFVWKVERANDKLWHQQHEKLVEFKRKKGHCLVPTKYEQDKSLGMWVNKQRSFHNNSKLRLDRMKLLDELDFVWIVERGCNIDDKVWQQQHEKLVEFKRKKGHCLVPQKYDQDPPLADWVSTQRSLHGDNKIRLDRQKVLDEIEFVWKAVAGPARYSTSSSSSVGLPNEALVEEPEQAQGHVPNRFECPSRNKKRPRTCLADSGEMAAKTNQRGKTTGSCASCVEDDVGGLDGEDSNPSLVTISIARIGSDLSGQEVVQKEEATTSGEIPSGWTRVKLEPDC
jgi:hypothetical protein